MKRIILVLAALVMLYLPLEAGMDSVQPMTYLSNNVPFCTTFSIDQRAGFWQTAAHCVEEEGIEYRVGGYPARTVLIDKEADLAVVMSEAHAQGLKLSPAGVNVGTPIEIQGYPVGMVNKVSTWGKMGAINMPLSQWGIVDLLSAYVALGNSGSPVLSKGKVVGMVVAKARSSEYTVSVRVDTIRRVCGLLYAR